MKPKKRYNRLKIFKTKKWFYEALEKADLPMRTYYDWVKKGRIEPVPRRIKLNRCGEPVVSEWNNEIVTEWNPETTDWVKTVIEEKKKGGYNAKKKKKTRHKR